jgi:hypothetical protein
VKAKYSLISKIKELSEFRKINNRPAQLILAPAEYSAAFSALVPSLQWGEKQVEKPEFVYNGLPIKKEGFNG